jgi:hypothetical protein
MKSTHAQTNILNERNPKSHGNGAKEINESVYKIGETVLVKEAIHEDRWRGRIIAFKSNGQVILRDVTHNSERVGCSLWRHQDMIEKINN